MCSFLITNVSGFNLARSNAFQQMRGPDHTNLIELEGIIFLHNLLSIQGDFLPQPFLGNAVACVYNGEIYNHKTFGSFRSDGECLLPAYETLGASFVRELDGEYALALVDWRDRALVLATDLFGTKPLHYSVEGSRFGVSSYASALREIRFRTIRRLEPNSVLVICLDTGKVRSISPVCAFTLRQHKHSFDDWESAFASAISKRTRHCREKIFVGLSSGYDSGSICCELDRQGTQYKTYSIMNNETIDVITARISRRPAGSEFDLIYPSFLDKAFARRRLKKKVEPVHCQIVSTGTRYVENWSLHDDPAACGLSIICGKAKRDGRRIYISGQGADEIISDYGFDGVRIYPHSNFGGLFPSDLGIVFPWASFYGSTQAAYLMKEEYVAGSFGIETRYPFLDKSVVQEFLSLAQHLKNGRYKSVLRNLLEQTNYPCSFDEKRGFIP